MFGLIAPVRVDLAKRPADVRKGFDGLAALASSRLAVATPAEFRRRRQISLHSFRKHLDRPLPSTPVPGDDRSSACADHHFFPVTVFPDPILSITASRHHVELILADRRRIAVASGSDTRTLRRLIAVREGRPCSD